MESFLILVAIQLKSKEPFLFVEDLVIYLFRRQDLCHWREIALHTNNKSTKYIPPMTRHHFLDCGENFPA